MQKYRLYFFTGYLYRLSSQSHNIGVEYYYIPKRPLVKKTIKWVRTVKFEGFSEYIKTKESNQTFETLDDKPIHCLVHSVFYAEQNYFICKFFNRLSTNIFLSGGTTEIGPRPRYS